MGELSGDLEILSGTLRDGLNTAEEGGLVLLIFGLDVAEVERLGVFVGSRIRIESPRGTSSFSGESSSSSWTTSTLLGGRGKFDIRMTLDRL